MASHFTAGVVSASLATLACAMIIGHGDFSKGWGQLSSGAQICFVKATSSISKTMAKSQTTTKAGSERAKDEASKAQAWTSSVVGQARGHWEEKRPLDTLKAAPLELRARHGQSSLREALLGADAQALDQPRLASDPLPSQGDDVSLQWAKQATLRSLAVALVRDPWVRAAALPGTPAPQSADQAPSKAERAFAEAFSETLAASATPEQTRQWGLPAPREAAVPHADPIARALEAGSIAAAKASPRAKETTAASTGLAWDAAGSGAARAFAAGKLAQSAAPSSIKAKLASRREAPNSPAPKSLPIPR